MAGFCTRSYVVSFPPLSLDGVNGRLWMKAIRDDDQSSHALEYASPEREALGRWFVRRAIIFVAVLGSIFALLALLGLVAHHYGWFDFMAQK